ncbi:MAG: signal peptidase I [Thermodesulfobacteriota bacterium]|nr:signal peptidase I [Thermodesulfobacteriota bacterium]
MKKKSVIREYIEAFAVAIVLALIIRTFVVQAFKIPSGSMEPTLLVGDHILVNKFIYGEHIPFTDMKILDFRDPKQGEIIVFVYPKDESKDFIKRVIGVEGDTIEIKDKKLYINGQPFVDPYGHFKDNAVIPGHIQPRDNFGPVTVPEDSLFVMGDNRDRSADSRFWGFVRLNQVKGKAFLIYWSWGGFMRDIKFGRIGKLIR